MKKILISIVLLTVNSVAHSATVYLDEAEYLTALSGLGHNTIYESFEDGNVWVRSSTVTPSTTSLGLIWQSNFTNSTTGAGAAYEGAYGFYALPHGNATDGGSSCDGAEDPIPEECWLNDGWIITSEDSKTLYGIGGWIDSNTGGAAKITFLLDGYDVSGNDTDNIDNWNRDGEAIGSGWTFVGVIETNGFQTVEIRELSGKDVQQEFIFGDSFTIGVSAVPIPASVWLFGSGLIGLIGIARGKKVA
jgi:hypothetical protein